MKPTTALMAARAAPMSKPALLGLDIGAHRIGVALTRPGVSIAQPLTTLIVPPEGMLAVIKQIDRLVAEHAIETVVAGWPRGMSGQTTDQTRTVEAFAAQLKAVLTVPVELQDEALTSQKAEAELNSRKKPYTKAEVDALAATYILDDYILEHVL